MGPPQEPTLGKVTAATWVFVALHTALGGIAVELAANEEFAAGKAHFASNAWRIVWGLCGGGLLFFALRTVLRAVSQNEVMFSEALMRRARRNGLLVLTVGVFFFCCAVVDEVAQETVALDSWAGTVYAFGGGYLALMGLVYQLNPTNALRRQRLRQGQGVHGTARILRANDTGTTVNESPMVAIDFEIEVEGRMQETTQRSLVQQSKLALLIPGSTVDILADPGDHTVFTVDWDSWEGPRGERAQP